jgi:hypothetical protein
MIDLTKLSYTKEQVLKIHQDPMSKCNCMAYDWLRMYEILEKIQKDWEREIEETKMNGIWRENQWKAGKL